MDIGRQQRVITVSPLEADPEIERSNQEPTTSRESETVGAPQRIPTAATRILASKAESLHYSQGEAVALDGHGGW